MASVPSKGRGGGAANVRLRQLEGKQQVEIRMKKLRAEPGLRAI
jgi:hypothetical protein